MFFLASLFLLNASLRGWVQRALPGLHDFGNSWGSPGQPGKPASDTLLPGVVDTGSSTQAGPNLPTSHGGR